MLELYTGQTLIFPDGSSKTKEELTGTPYELLLKVPSVIDVSFGITTSYSPIGPLAESYGVKIERDNYDTAISKINAIKAQENKNTILRKTTYGSTLKAVQIVALSFTDEQAIEIPDLYPEYEVNHEYKQGDRFQYGSALYKVNQDHTSQEQWVPGETGTESLYTNLMLDDSGYPIWKQPTGAHDAYNIGDIVNYNGTLYKSLIDGNAYAPDVYPAGWEVYTEPTE